MRILVFALLLLIGPGQAAAFEDIPLDVRQVDVSPKRASHNGVFASAQDSDGYIWLASLRGMNVYDGNVVRPVLEDILRGTRIHDIHIDSDDVLWVATNSGVLAYELKTQNYRWHHAGDDGGLLSNTVHCIYEDKRGTLWVGTANGDSRTGGWENESRIGLHRYEPSFGRFERVDVLDQASLAKNSIFDIAEDANRNMWVATDLGVYRLTGNQRPSTFVPLSTGDAYSAKSITFDGSGNLWACVNSNKSNRLWTLPASATHTALIPAPEINAKLFFDLYTDVQGNVWICTNSGLFRYAHQEARFFRHPLIFNDPALRIPDYIVSIMETSSRTMWIGTINMGVLQYAPHSGASIVELTSSASKNDRPFSSILSLVSAPDSRIYIAPKSGGIYRTDPATTSRLFLSPRLEATPFFKGDNIKSMAWTGDNSLVCGLNNAILRIDAEQNVERVQVVSNPDTIFADKDVEYISPMPDGNIWFASKYLLYSWTPGEAAPRLQMHPTGTAITHLAQAGDILWVAHGANITRIDTRTETQSPLNVPAGAWADNATVKTIMVEHPETMWIGTTQSVFRFDLRSGALAPILTAGQERIPNALSFWPDDNGNVWLHTQEKIFCVPRGSSKADEKLLGASHPSASISASPAPLSEHALVYGYTDGLLLIDSDRLFTDPSTPPKISEIRVFGKPLPASPLGRMADNLELGYLQNYLTFTFSVPEAKALHLPRYFYLLEGVDSSWNDSGLQTSVSYAHLEPGRYVLHVKDGLDGDAITSMGITIRAPWWMTAWAKAGYALLLILALLVASRLFARVQTTRIRKEMLENLVMQDPLTEVPNRRKFKEVLAAEKSRCKRSNHQISVLMIDIDFFKGFNDRFGHQAGDKALRIVAQTVSSALKRPEDFVARFGGEEFVVVLPSTNRAGAERVAQKIQDAIYKAEIPYPGSPLSDRVTLSIGISTFSPQTDLHIDSGLFSADQALYQAKRNGRNCVFYKDHCLALTPVRQ